MSCEEFLRLLDEERLLADPAAAEHAASCPACGQALARWQAARRELLAMSSEMPPPFLHARIMAHVRAEAAERRQLRRLSSLRRALLATAAVAVLASLAGYEVLRQRATPAPPALPAEGKSLPAASDRAADETARPTSEKQAATAPSAGTLQQRTREAAKGRRQAMPPGPGRNHVAPGAPPSIPAHEGLPERRDAAPAPAMAPGAVGAAPREAPMAESITASRDAAAGLTAYPVAATKAEAAGNVSCLVRAVSTGQTRSIALPARVAPSPGEGWTITVARDGSSTIVDARGADLTHSLLELRDRLRTLALPPDRYLLTRRSE
ncbi:MAG: hypothetical protein ACM3O7_05845 [Acidobacteriota bacterium]